jgi:hypothetical protein
VIGKKMLTHAHPTAKIELTILIVSAYTVAVANNTSILFSSGGLENRQNREAGANPAQSHALL